MPTPTRLPAPQAPMTETPATLWLVGLGGVSFAAHMLVAGNYGYFRDEPYYIADGHHLQAGYVDQPLLMGWLGALGRVTVGDGLVAIPVGPALAGAALVGVTGLMARGLGGGAPGGAARGGRGGPGLRRLHRHGRDLLDGRARPTLV